MTGPNLGKELSVLVCDPRGKITGFVEGILGEREEHRYNRLEIKRVDEPGKAGDLIVRGSIPQYAAVIYEGSVIKGNVGGIARVRRHDPFVPQLVVSGKGIVPDEEEAPRHILMQAARAGAIYHASTPEELKQNIGKILGGNPSLWPSLLRLIMLFLSISSESINFPLIMKTFLSKTFFNKSQKSFKFSQF